MLRDTHTPSSRSAQDNIVFQESEKSAGYEHLRIPETQEPGVCLLGQGYQETYLDLARSKSGLRPRSGDGIVKHGKLLSATGTAGAGKETTLFGGKSTLKEEMPHAIRAYGHAVACVRDIMASAAQGRFQGGAAHTAVQGLVDSLERNIDALLCLPRMRQRDAYMYTHCVNVSVLLAAYALVSGQDRRKVIIYGLAGLFHDIGKALLPVSLLSARRTLSVTEQTLVMRHPMLGCDLLATLPDLHSEVIMAVLEHHERYDGSGYPKGLAGDAISEVGHLAAIADTYDALSSRRPYKGAIFPHKTLGVLYQMRRKHFHPEIVERFVRMVGIYPVGSVVELKDGYRGVVTASNYANPMLPVVTLALDPQGGPMCPHVCDMAKEAVSGIARCVPTEVSGLDPCRALGIVL
ncbi:MAG: HD-GYP domain-containing protein [Desulfovibrionaceae bacterium]|nr:HD-GYP domain-containing protein [Desulfovibrionaceae bacterium]